MCLGPSPFYKVETESLQKERQFTLQNKERKLVFDQKEERDSSDQKELRKTRK